MTPEAQLEILARSCVDLHSQEELLEKLKEGRPLRIKYGADPSAPDLHLGHSVPLWRLRQFQDLGHTVVFIIGDFTGMIGDPSGKSKTRPMLTREQVEANARTYAEQLGKILDVDKCEVHYNSEWFSKMTTAEFLALASHYTVARMLERDDFALRMRDEVPISMLELMYPLVQAYDSVAIDSDIEIGGTDQLFNFLVARDIMRAYGKTPQCVMTWPLLVGLDGHVKMSKSLGNYVGITDEPNDMFGKLMSIPDETMPQYFRLLLGKEEQEVQEMREAMASGAVNPRNLKAELGRAIVGMYYDDAAAQAASDEFDHVFAAKQVPTDIAQVDVSEELEDGHMWIVQAAVVTGLAPTKGEARRLVRQGGVRLNDAVISDEMAQVEIHDGDVLNVGKRRFAQLRVK
ncbi:tyrosine--tRNA ligase [bacterium]|nr:tyrosine--tRNA ligase [bacterium]